MFIWKSKWSALIAERDSLKTERDKAILDLGRLPVENKAWIDANDRLAAQVSDAKNEIAIRDSAIDKLIIQRAEFTGEIARLTRKLSDIVIFPTKPGRKVKTRKRRKNEINL